MGCGRRLCQRQHADVYIKRLREKIEDDPVEPQIIKTVRGMGYKVDE